MLYIITFDVRSFNKVLIDKIHAYRVWAMLSPKSFLIVSDESPEVICNNLKICMSEGERIFVGTLTSPAAWVGMPQEVTDWIHEYFKR